MSAPVKTPTRPRPRVSVDWKGTEAPARRIPAQRGAVTIPAPRKGSQKGAQKAYARRDERVRRAAPKRAVPKKATQVGTGRAQFVLLIMGLFATGLVLTLWLSTAAAADSYALQQARTDARTLTEQSERLHREVAAMESTPALAQRAADLGMVPVQDPARLVVAPDGGVTVVGEPRAAVGHAPVPAANPMPAPDAGPSQTAVDAGAAQAGPPPAAQPDPAQAQPDPAAQAAQDAQTAQNAQNAEAASQQAQEQAVQNPQQPGGA
ncbi:hypothetical protein [Pseudonocardia oroxyli]|uniref:Cell division protein FtsI (Penicillin-binding protein 3) n=1 Tax=Pseudonocardia oroxyli TaxID=366584 RepID=A0A1G7EKB5_PSEOR|nr:hypothetical protein [Pseudonocardia oroxyli]SDE64141.1 cell division protein FtsI (penicillin-binding protein 3) [Pseudonocardia oroxyli]